MSTSSTTSSPPIEIHGESFDERLASIAALIGSKKNIVVLVGAGISVSCGIPDFRSRGTGLYHTLNCQELGLSSPEDLFDIEAFREDPRPFYRFAHSLYPGKVDPGPSHKFLAWLDRQKMLLRVYTQNIDGLEQAAGVCPNKMVYAHGSLLGATCMQCRAKYSADDIAADVQAGEVPLCQQPTAKKARISQLFTNNNKPPTAKHAMRLRRPSAKNNIATNNKFDTTIAKGLCGGVLKPNVTFFGEKLADNIGRSLEKDYQKADALIVMGTSLSVAPMSSVVNFLPPNIPRILINRNIVHAPKALKKGNNSHNGDDISNDCLFHVCLLGNCDDVVQAVKKKMKITKTTESNNNALYSNGLESNRLVTDDNCSGWLKNQPKESVLLFSGAILSLSAVQDAENPQIAIVHCDECQNQISGKMFSCTTCFDFDVCGNCYPLLEHAHADGKHEFIEGDQSS